MGGSVSGGLWGLALGGIGLGIVSLINEQPDDVATGPVTPEVVIPEVAVTEAPPADPTPVATDTPIDPVSEPPSATAQGVVAEAPQVDATPIAPPQAPEVTASPTLPDIAPRADQPETTQDSVSSRVVADAPQAPAPEPDVVIATEPAPIPATPTPREVVVADLQSAPVTVPQTSEADTDVAVGIPPALAPTQTPEPDDVVAEVTTPEVPVVAELAAPEQDQSQAGAVPDVAADAAVAVETEEAADPVAPADAAQLPEVEDLQTDNAGDVASVVPDATPSAPASTQDVIIPQFVTVPEAPQAEPAPAVVAEPAPETTQPPTTLPEPTGSGVRVNRPGAEPTETAGQEAEVITAEPLPDDAPALLRYAGAFDGDPTLPLIAIVMVDDGSLPTAPADIAALAVPVTVVIDALQNDAAKHMAAYRAAGVEVMLQTALPSGAVPADVEVAFEAAFDILPETVGLFSDTSGILQGNRAVAEQVVEILGAEGRGLVVVERGLSSSLRIAQQAGLPAAAVLRDLDGGGENGAAVTRALDQAAFRARQSGDAVLLARVSAGTLAALQSWGTENNGDQIALAPVSAILQDGDVAE